MRNAFADEITKTAAVDDRLVLLSGDIGNRLFDKFKETAPERFFNCGVAEANMISMASGLAQSGLKPIAYTITPFITTRVLEQIRLDLGYHHAAATVVGVGGGLSYASLGSTHHACEDIAFLRAIPGMSVLCPGDAQEVRACLRVALEHDGPLYIRLGKKNEPVVHGDVPEMRIGGSIKVRDGKDICLLAVGTMLPNALDVAEQLERRGISAEVVSFYSAKPLDVDRLRDAFDRFRRVVTIEEHSVVGGVGSAVAEWLVDEGNASPGQLIRIGTPDIFFHDAGNQEFLRKQAGLDAETIVERLAKEFVHQGAVA